MRLFQSVPAALAALAALAAVCAAAAETMAGPEVVLTNDGVSAVVDFRVSGDGGESWSDNLLGEAMVAVGETLPVALEGAPGDCVFAFRTTLANGQVVDTLSYDVCAAPELTMGFALGLDEAGTGRGFAIVATDDETGDAQPMAAPVAPVAPTAAPRPGRAAAGAAPIDRGVPICPGDPRCKGKKK